MHLYVVRRILPEPAEAAPRLRTREACRGRAGRRLKYIGHRPHPCWGLVAICPLYRWSALRKYQKRIWSFGAIAPGTSLPMPDARYPLAIWVAKVESANYVTSCARVRAPEVCEMIILAPA